MELPIELQVDAGDTRSADLVYQTRYKNIKIGDTITCVEGEDNEYRLFTEGKVYTVIKFRPCKGWGADYNDIVIYDDNGEEIQFEIGSATSGSFCSTYILRKYKLRDIEKNIIHI